MIRIAGMNDTSVTDGLGIRVVVYLQGCPHHCPGCHNPTTWAYGGGEEMTEAELAELIVDNLEPYHRGVTFSGGDPLYQHEALARVIELLPKDIDIWCYTGYRYEEVKSLPVMSMIDVLVDGRFEIGRKSLALAFRGSSNQRIIRLKESDIGEDKREGAKAD